jgi:translation initiation factor IF-3
LSRPVPPRFSSSGNSYVRVNGKIRAREVRVIGQDSQQLGVLALHDAIRMAQAQGVDLVEVAPNATPPVCRLVDFGKFRYEQAKKEKEAKKHHHANKVKEIQLSATIDPHDFGVKLSHAIDFLCEEMKVKVTLRFRGREMAHKEFGFQIIGRFINAIAPYGHPDAPEKLIGKGITVMLSPLPRSKRGKNPRQLEGQPQPVNDAEAQNRSERPPSGNTRPQVNAAPAAKPREESNRVPTNTPQNTGFGHNPFAELDIKLGQ